MCSFKYYKRAQFLILSVRYLWQKNKHYIPKTREVTRWGEQYLFSDAEIEDVDGVRL